MQMKRAEAEPPPAQDQFGLMPAARMIGSHFAISAARKRAALSGVLLEVTSMVISPSLFFTESCDKARLKAALAPFRAAWPCLMRMRHKQDASCVRRVRKKARDHRA